MHSSPIATLMALHSHVSADAADRPSATRLVALRANLEGRAERELATYFARKRVADPRSAEDEAIEATLASISAYPRGVLTLYHDARVWPQAVTKALGPYATLGIRLQCADHPASGSTPALEAAAAERLGAIVTAEGAPAWPLLDLEERARRHHRRALHAYAKQLAARETKRG